jgi:site-specific recombinase XerD
MHTYLPLSRALLERDREMQAFIDSFPDAVRAEKEASQTHRQAVARLLTEYSGALARRGTVPTAEAAKGLRERLEEKEMQHGQSLSTRNKLRGGADFAPKPVH